MKTITNENLLKNKNLYKTVVLTSLRAREISLGAKPLIETKNTNPTVIAMQEIQAGKVSYKEKKK
ncbi:MAG TPA: DNA-directed RNA polymerase subunit omega [bacterium]|nr:DNA-directed RNA polymerase subunit omega [bacterium]